MIMAKNYYEILGVSKNASADELKSAYRKLAKQYHPDLFTTASEQEKKNAEEKFKEINHAYDVLSDPQKKAAYDAYGDENGPQPGAGGFGGFNGGGGFGLDMDDIFSTIFSGFGGGSRSQRANGPQRGQDILTAATISFDEAAFGVQRIVNVRRVESCPDCKGTGAKDGTAFRQCTKCGGSGRVTTTQRTPFGQFSSTGVCPDCKGRGKIITEPCKTCGGQGRFEKTREVKINIPAGIDNGQRITYQGEGHSGINGGEKGSLVVEIRVQPHKLFVRSGKDLKITVPVNFAEAALGCTLQIPTLYGVQQLKVPEGTQSGTEFKIKNCGIKDLRGTGKGDLYVKVYVEVPKSVNHEQKEMLKKFADTCEAKQYPQKKAYEEAAKTVVVKK
ncbi:MAG: molecular chaperone DnaJ [Clostridia bacterium]|nr:molecular chaperone DnaJ [Clostridia bacterium]